MATVLKTNPTNYVKGLLLFIPFIKLQVAGEAICENKLDAYFIAVPISIYTFDLAIMYISGNTV